MNKSTRASEFVCEAVRQDQPPLCPRCKDTFKRVAGPYGYFWACRDDSCGITASRSTFDGQWHISCQYTRTARKAAHAALDPLWKNGHAHRSTVYRWLAEKLRIKDGAQHCHILHFDVATCRKVVALSLDMLMVCCFKRWGDRGKISPERALYLNVIRRKWAYEALGDTEKKALCVKRTYIVVYRMGDDDIKLITEGPVPNHIWREPLQILEGVPNG